MVEMIGYREGLPVVVDPGILDPGQFIDEVVTKRIPNPFMPDTPQRIATDTSQKLPIRSAKPLRHTKNPPGFPWRTFISSLLFLPDGCAI